MIVILEGPDGGGKTTLRKEFVKKGYKYIPCVPREWPNQYDMYNKLFMSIYSTEKVVMERCFISELVYRTVMNDLSPNISLKDVAWLLESHKLKIVNCTTDTAFEDSIKRGDSYITTKSQHMYVSHIYDVIFDLIDKFTNSDVIKYNWQKDNINNLIKKLSENIK